MEAWIEIARTDELLPETALERIVEERVIALFHVDGEFFALDGICPHQGGPLGQGNLEGFVIRCPWHGWSFDVRSGQCGLSDQICQKTYAVRVQDQRIFIRLE